MTAEQMANVKRRKPGKTPSDTWFGLFRILFPEAPLPESPYVESVSTDAIRAFIDHFQRRAQAILSSLIREQLGTTLVLHSDQQRIIDSALESAIARLVMQIGGAEQEVEAPQVPLESSEIEIQDVSYWPTGVPLLDEGTEESHMLESSDPFMASSNHDDPHNPLIGTSSWPFERLDDFGDVETIFH
jgi:hypothetical protein